MAYSTSAFQRYFELHSPKTDPNKKTSKPTITQSNIIDDTGAAITEKTSKSNVSDVIGKGYKEIRATTPPSPFWRSGGFSSETHLTRFRFCILKSKNKSILQPHSIKIMLIFFFNIKQFTDNNG